MEKTYRHPLWFWLPALFLGWIFDALFYDRDLGISFPIFILLCLLIGWLVSRRNGVAWHRNAIWLSICIGFFAILAVSRTDPLTMGLNILLTLSLGSLLANTAVSGDWPRFAMLDYIQAALHVLLDAIRQPLIHRWGNSKTGEPHGIENLKPILRGIGLAIPFLTVFSCLFASADPIFEKGLSEFLRIERLPEFVFRLGIILCVAYGAMGVLLHAVLSPRAGRKLFSDGRLIPPWLGTLEALVVLLLVILLFVVFVAIQFRYLFGGQSNISAEHFTYSEYAVRGFWELIIVALISLGMFFGLHASTDRSKPGEARVFSLLSFVLMLLVQVILFSALTRLGLYEEAYGFSRLRTYPHVFLIWVGILFAAMIVLELSGRLRFHTQAVLLCFLGFVITLNVIKVDDFIVRQNIVRAIGTDRLDFGYLSSLSTDAIPALRDAFLQEDADTKIFAGVSLVCFRSQHPVGERSWQEFLWAEKTMRDIYLEINDRLLPFSEDEDEQGNPVVRYEGKMYSCHSFLTNPDHSSW